MFARHPTLPVHVVFQSARLPVGGKPPQPRPPHPTCCLLQSRGTFGFLSNSALSNACSHAQLIALFQALSKRVLEIRIQLLWLENWKQI